MPEEVYYDTISYDGSKYHGWRTLNCSFLTVPEYEHKTAYL